MLRSLYLQLTSPNGVFDKLTKLTGLGLETNQLKSVPVPSLVKGCTSSFVLMNI